MANEPKVVATLETSEITKLESFRKKIMELKMEIGEFELRKIRTFAEIRDHEVNMQKYLKELSTKYNLPEGKTWQIIEDKIVQIGE